MVEINPRFGLKTTHLASARAGCFQAMGDAVGAADGEVYDWFGGVESRKDVRLVSTARQE